MRDGPLTGDPTRHPARSELRTVTNALRVLQALADAERPIAVTELADELALPASTTHRILATLTRSGFAIRAPSRRYRAGPSLVRIARRSLLDHVRLAEAARPTLAWLAGRSGETSHLAVLDGEDTLSIDHVQSPQPVIAHHPVGSRVPAHATAVGQALLAHVPDVAAQVREGAMLRLTPQTITDPQDFDRTLAEIRVRGYALNIGQLHPDTAGAAAPIFDEDGVPIASVGISGPAARIGEPIRLAELGRLTAEGAREIGRRLATTAEPRHPDGPSDGVSGLEPVASLQRDEEHA